MGLNFGQRVDRGFPQDTLQFTSDYNDFLTGSSWKDFYYGYMTENATSTKVLWTASFSSTTASTTVQATSTSFTKDIDLDFDLEFQGERVVGGDGIIEIKFAVTNNGAVPITEGYIIAKIRKLSGATETDIGTSQSNTVSVNTATTTTETDVLKIQLTRTALKKGDKLRLTIEGWAQSSIPAAGNNITVYHEGDRKKTIPFARLDEY